MSACGVQIWSETRCHCKDLRWSLFGSMSTVKVFQFLPVMLILLSRFFTFSDMLRSLIACIPCMLNYHNIVLLVSFKLIKVFIFFLYPKKQATYYNRACTFFSFSNFRTCWDFALCHTHAAGVEWKTCSWSLAGVMADDLDTCPHGARDCAQRAEPIQI